MHPRFGAPERRRRPRAEPARAELVAVILGTFREMPGLSLHLTQAARLFGVQFSTCAAVFTDLVDAGRLRRGLGGQYVATGVDLPAPAVSAYAAHGMGVARRGR